MKFKQPKQSIESKIKEYNKLLISQDNNERLKELKADIDWFFWGIVIYNNS